MANTAQDDLRGVFTHDFDWTILGRFQCASSEVTLLQAKQTFDYGTVLQQYDGQVKAAAKYLLYPGHLQETSGKSGDLWECYYRPSTDSLVQGWIRLISDLGHIAASIYRSFRELPSDVDRYSRATHEKLAIQLVVAMRLMLLARLYFEREKINNDFANPMQSERAKLPYAGDVQKRVRAVVGQYDRQLRRWRITHVLPRGWKDGSDAFAYDQWSQSFGLVAPGEEGWSSFPRLFKHELRYLRSRSSLRQLVRDALRVFSSITEGGWRNRILLFLPHVVVSSAQFIWNVMSVILLWLFMLSCGFGFRPRRIAGTVISVIPLFAGIYFADDAVIERCSSPSGQQFVTALYSALTNLVSPGSSAHALCGSHIGIIAYIETLIGYIVLSVLAAMLFVWLTDR